MFANIARKWNEFDWWVIYITQEIELCEKLGAFGLILHTGKQLKLKKQEAMENMLSLLVYIHNKTKNTKIILENCAGQGTELFYDIVLFCKFMKLVYSHIDKRKHNCFGCCIDTCHLFAAGYNLNIEASMKSILNTINTIIGTDKIKLIHMNNSIHDYGSRIDRHHDLHNGKIKITFFVNLMKLLNKLEIPVILETPNATTDYKYLTNIS